MLSLSISQTTANVIKVTKPSQVMKRICQYHPIFMKGHCKLLSSVSNWTLAQQEILKEEGTMGLVQGQEGSR